MPLVLLIRHYFRLPLSAAADFDIIDTILIT